YTSLYCNMYCGIYCDTPPCIAICIVVYISAFFLICEQLSLLHIKSESRFRISSILIRTDRYRYFVSESSISQYIDYFRQP
ncbi:hypothetical protein LOTGIDRAFT_148985, partial [Lottia gigantea]